MVKHYIDGVDKNNLNGIILSRYVKKPARSGIWEESMSAARNITTLFISEDEARELATAAIAADCLTRGYTKNIPPARGQLRQELQRDGYYSFSVSAYVYGQAGKANYHKWVFVPKTPGGTVLLEEPDDKKLAEL